MPEHDAPEAPDHAPIPIQCTCRLPGALDPTEDWTGKTSPAVRRKLQNRLNQRARRRRQAGYPSAASAPQQEEGQSLPLTTDSGVAAREDDLEPSRCLLGRPENRETLVRLAREGQWRHELGAPDPTHLTGIARYNVFHAFTCNARALGFDDAWLVNDSVSPFCAEDPAQRAAAAPGCPPSLRPTALQRAVEHHPWIDFFPCPRMRDNFLRAVQQHGEDRVEEDDLCHDIVDVGGAAGVESAALIVWGEPWSPAGWEVTEPFLRKWGWLLRGCAELQEATNMWRQKRGLGKLRFEEC